MNYEIIIGALEEKITSLEKKLKDLESDSAALDWIVGVAADGKMDEAFIEEMGMALGRTRLNGGIDIATHDAIKAAFKRKSHAFEKEMEQRASAPF